MNFFSATGHVKSKPVRRVSEDSASAVFTVEIEDEIFPGRSKYTVAAFDKHADYAVQNIDLGSEIFVQGRLRKQGTEATIYAKQLRVLL